MNELLELIDDYIEKDIFENKKDPGEPTKEGIQLQLIYDRIYSDN